MIDAHLQDLIERLFLKVSPIISDKSWVHRLYPHITFALAHPEKDRAQWGVYRAIKYYGVKLEGMPIREEDERGLCTLHWRQLPDTTLCIQEGPLAYMWICKCRCSWFKEQQ